LTLAIVLAGCTGVIDSAEDRAKDAAKGAANDVVNDTLNDSVGGVLNASAMDDRTNVPANVTLVGFGFDQPETYTYEIVMGQGNLPSAEGQQARGRLVADAQDVSERNVTLTTRYELDGETAERTVSGTQEDVAFEFTNVTQPTDTSSAMRDLQTHANLAATMGMSLYLAGYVTPFIEDQSLPSGDEETVRYEALGTDSYAGVECSVTELSINGTRSAESCVSTDLGLPAYVVLYDENGTADTWIELVEYES
jgi:hypothetical protein